MASRGSWLLFAGTTLLVAGCTPPNVPAPPPLSLPSEIFVQSGGAIIAASLEDYVLATVLAEVSPIADEPAVAARIFEVQAIVARSYAVANLGRHRAQGFDLCDSTHCQIYDPSRLRTSRLVTIAREAVRRTAGEILTFASRPAETLFHADCGGSTAAADAVWGGQPVPYLLPLVDDLVPRVHRSWRWTASADDLRSALSGDLRTDIGGAPSDVSIVTRDESGRAQLVALHRSQGEPPRVVRGEDLRGAVTRAFGPRALQSTRFSVRHAGSTFVFEGTGYGHGVGLCQTGAAARARRGETTHAILAAYFAGTGMWSQPAPK